MAFRTSSPGPSESVFSADESFTPLGSDFGTDGYEGARAGSLALAAAAGPVDLSQLNLVSLNRPWNEPGESNRQAFHAISTVLSHPTRKPAPLRASRVPLPAGPQPDPIPKVNRRELDAYLALVGPEWDRYQAAMGSAGGGDRGPGLDLDAALEERRASSSAIATPSLRSIPDVFFNDDFNLGNPHTFSLVAALADAPRRHSLASPNASFASLPPILEPLDEADSSLTTVQGGDDEPPGSSRPPAESSKPVNLDDAGSSQQLQARLSTHLSLVEQHLVLEISQRSASFFTALTNLQDLQTESESCLSRIESLQQELRILDEGHVQKGLEAVALSRSLRGLKAVDGAVKELRSIDEALAMIRQLVANDDVYGALDLWEEVDGWLKRKGKPKPEAADTNTGGRRRKSSTASRMRSSSLLGEVAEGAEEGEEGGAVEVSSSACPAMLQPPRLRRHESSSSSIGQPSSRARKQQPDLDLTTSAALAHLPQTLAALSLSIASQLELELTGFLSAELGHKKQTTEVSLEDRLRPLLLGLIRARESNRIVDVFRQIALSETRDAAKKFVTSDQAETSDATSAALTKRLKALSHMDFLAMETSMFDALLGCLRSIDVAAKAIETVLSDSRASTGFVLNSSLTQELHDVLTAAAELAHSRASKVVGVRTDQHAQLALADFIRMFNAAWAFVVDCEVLCQKMIVGLRGTMVVQAKTFLQTYHSQRLSSSARLVENEIWSPEEPSAAQQHALDLILEAAVSDPSELVMAKDGFTTASAGAPSSNGVAVDNKSSTLRVEDRTFFVVPATSASMALLVDYLRLIINIELITTDAMAKVIEYLKSFNSRTCQVVLGAGAMRSAGLKNITAKHLALASQSLSVMVTLIPYIREAVRRHLSPKQAVMLVEFDKLKRDYQEHQNEIHAKLIAIMGDRLAIHIGSFHEIDWEAPAPKPGKPSDHIEMLIKETTQLHKILSKYLPESTVELVISQVFASINNGLADAFAAVELKSDGAKSRLALDAMHLVKRLSTLTGVTPIPATLPTLVKDKPVPRRPVGASMKNLMRRVSSQSKIGEGFKGSDGTLEAEGGAPPSDPELLAPPGASSLGTPLSSLDPSEAPSPRGDPESQSPCTEQGLEAALQKVVSPLGLPRRLSSLAPSPIALGTPSELPPLPSTPGMLDAPSDPLDAQEREPSSSADVETSAPPPVIVEVALPPLPSVESEPEAGLQPVEAADVLGTSATAVDGEGSASSDIPPIETAAAPPPRATEKPSTLTPQVKHEDALAADTTVMRALDASKSPVDDAVVAEPGATSPLAEEAAADGMPSTKPAVAAAVHEHPTPDKLEDTTVPPVAAASPTVIEQKATLAATATEATPVAPPAEEKPTTNALSSGDNDAEASPALVEPPLDDAQPSQASVQPAADEQTPANGTADETAAPDPTASEEPSAANSDADADVGAGAESSGGAKKAKKNRKKKKKGGKSGTTSPAAVEGAEAEIS